jgi:TPR repeat protein
VAQDYREAARWHRLVAEQGISQAQYNLATMYEKGQGVVQDRRCVNEQCAPDVAAARVPVLSLGRTRLNNWLAAEARCHMRSLR